VVLLYVRLPLSLPDVENPVFERGIDICRETVPFWRNRFGRVFASDMSAQAGFSHAWVSPLSA